VSAREWIVNHRGLVLTAWVVFGLLVQVVIVL